MPQAKFEKAPVDRVGQRVSGPPEKFWGELRTEIWRDPVGRREIASRLLRLTDAVRARLVDSRNLADEWRGLGIQVRQVRMRARGLCSGRDGSRVVFVNTDDPYEIQRFTAAHEVAHLLLTNEQLRRMPFSAREEESLCDRFASQLLIDREVLGSVIGQADGPPHPEELLRLCGRLRVNVRPLQIAAGERLADTPYCVLLARYRGHWRRPHELAFRVESVAGARHTYLPRHQRLASIGLARLARAAEEADHGLLLEGSDSSVGIGLRGLGPSHLSSTARGRVDWRATVQGRKAPFLLAVLDLSALDLLGESEEPSLPEVDGAGLGRHDPSAR